MAFHLVKTKMAQEKLEEGHVFGVFDEVLSFISTSLALVAALAWNTAFMDLLVKYPVLKKHGYWLYAMFVTIIAVGFTHTVADMRGKNKK